ncbi:MAG: tetratricopeptide repeat protein, partial [Planctomycetales bacterium]|nr:tetratricopeptide repeat protein [Planctomycetales bacterium]
MRDRDIFLSAIEYDSQEMRDAYVLEACGDDAALRSRVEVLLQAAAIEDSFLETPPPGMEATLDLTNAYEPGAQVGAYRLLEQIGEGGMGVVYLAEQTEPVNRQVALKVIKPGMDTRQVIARFEAERQALAVMDHPNIAKVLGAGTTDVGRPYFVMELVRGVPITEYCDQHQFTPRERLQLFLPICHAVQHAHQKGIIHRDLKPSNILVGTYDDEAIAKVIDFGVAKATGGQLGGKTNFTQFGQIVGTMEYMSPEQAELNPSDVDTRSDVYSLGVLLYELLAGTPPFDRQRMRSAAFDELLRIIREEEPPRPSERLSTCETLPSVAANRQIEPRKLSTLVRGELDWIVMKALEKDRNRRYETANRLAEDIRNYLSDEPVIACPPSAVYRFRKFARRNKGLFAATAAVAASLLVGTGLATWQAVLATRSATAEREAREYADSERNRAIAAELLAEQRLKSEQEQRQRAEQAERAARREEAIATAVNDFLNQDLLGMAEPGSQLEQGLTVDREIKLRTVLDRAAEKIDGRFEDEPLVEAAIRSTIGWTYLNLGMHKEAEHHLLRAHELREAKLGPNHASTLALACDLAWLYWYQGRYDEALAISQETLERCRDALGPDHPVTLASLARVGYSQLGLNRGHEAQKALRERLNVLQRLAAASPSDAARVRMYIAEHDLANVLVYGGGAREAEAMYRRAFEFFLSKYGPEHPRTLMAKGGLARALETLNERVNNGKGAPELLAEVVADGERVWGPEHPWTLFHKSYLGRSMGAHGRMAEAVELLREVLSQERKAIGPEHKHTLDTTTRLSFLLKTQGRKREAEELYRETLALLRREVGPEHPSTQRVAKILERYMMGRSTDLMRSGDFEAARQVLTEAIELDLESANLWNGRGIVEYRLGNFQAAVEAFEKSAKLRGSVAQGEQFVPAMAAWQLGDHEGACLLFLESLNWLYADVRSLDHIALCEEAEAVIA